MWGSSGMPKRSARSVVSLPMAPRRNRRSVAGRDPSTMFSATLKVGTSEKCWCTMPIPNSRASCGEWMSAWVPRTRIVPASGSTWPNITFISVVLPAPFSPSSTWISPARRSKSMSTFARVSP